MFLLYLILFVWCPCVDINNVDRVPEMAALVSSAMGTPHIYHIIT